ncbi:hypothetical protein AYI68_g2286 [Smittium mucronatum]|uniref:Uncharacterized protein n=1 Tax=Smittium mucronatum TaxID=133383 RepID=A0A1R0H347_9FUNG|nr:hypothetical protein AYI68_g2286 [Smittium mucronatum]
METLYSISFLNQAKFNRTSLNPPHPHPLLFPITLNSKQIILSPPTNVPTTLIYFPHFFPSPSLFLIGKLPSSNSIGNGHQKLNAQEIDMIDINYV